MKNISFLNKKNQLIFKLFNIILLILLSINFIAIENGWGTEKTTVMKLDDYLLTNIFNDTNVLFDNTKLVEVIRSTIANKNQNTRTSLFNIFLYIRDNIDTVLNTLLIKDEDDSNKQKFSFIRKIIDAKYNVITPTDLPYIELLEKSSKIFATSRRLLFSQFLIFHLENFYEIRKETKQNNEDMDDVFEFNSNSLYMGKNINSSFKNKNNGVTFGGIMNINDKVFFVKAHQNYPYKSTTFTSGVVDSRTTMITSEKLFSGKSCSKTQLNGTILDLKEPFVYKILEKLDLGGNVGFIINPYIENGFFIQTAALTNFVTIDNLKNLIAPDVYKEIDSINNAQTKFNCKALPLFYNLTLVDLFGRIFHLTDFNSGNYGLINIDIKQKGFVNDILTGEGYLPKIIDFSSREVTKDGNEDLLGQSFLTGNTTVSYPDGSLMNKIVKKDLLETSSIPMPNDIVYPFYIYTLQEKFYFGYKALSQLEKRLQIYGQKHQGLFVKEGNIEDTSSDIILTKLLETEAEGIKKLMQVHRNDLPVLANRTNAELIGFKNGLAPEDIENERERLKYLDNAFKDLDVYCDNVVKNYRALKTFIENGYNKYFDRNGNLKQNDLQ